MTTNNCLSKKKILLVSYWGWPIFGGGEQFLYDSMKWCYDEDMIVTWICFAKADSKEKPFFEKMNVIQSPYGCIIQIPGGFCTETLKNWILLLNPDIVHHQGHMRYEVVKTCYEINMPIITGACFWNDIIDLDPNVGNVNIIKYSEFHKEAKNFRDILRWASCIYTASYFVTDAIQKVTGVRLNDVVYSSSLKENCILAEYDKSAQKYVTIINCHKFKGGELLLECMRRLPNVPFYIVKTENGSEELDQKILQEIHLRKLNGDASCKLVNRRPVIKDIFKKTKVFLAPSLVDETFCKTVNEAMCNAIPVITTGRGNISYMVGDCAITLDSSNINEWVNQINKLLIDTKYYQSVSDKLRERYEYFSEKVARDQLVRVINKVLFNQHDRKNNIMICTPWCDQGLGIQSRTYVKIFDKLGYKTHIFAFKPYFSTETNPKFQEDESEWAHPSIYYSPYSREDVTDDEIISFIKHRNIGMMIIPEICFDRVFQIAEIGKNMGVTTYCIPNIEIVRGVEINKYIVFDKILCNNKLCLDYFTNLGYNNTHLIEYTPLDSRLKFKKKSLDFSQNPLKFLALGGLNSISRKNIVLICEAFVIAAKVVQNIMLEINIQGSQIPDQISEYVKHSCINILIKHQTYADIINKYHDTNINIQVSKHEGLGLGFYESIITGTPVLSLDTAPHNEIITNANGWLIPCEHIAMTDNTDSIMDSVIFSPDVLAEKIIYLATHLGEVVKVTKNVRRDFDIRFNEEKISKRFMESFIN